MKTLALLPLLLSAILPATASAQSSEQTPPSVGWFVGLDWRAMGLAGHFSHGPGFQGGVTLLRGRLKLGVAGFARPGPINPATFTVQASGGQTYNGSSTLNLRSDGGLFGLMVAPVLPVPGVEWLSAELPVTLGQGAFGFYLHGEDRDTPDGRRVSAWENELLDGRDSSFGLGLDAGLRLVVRPDANALVRPYVGVHYSTVLGYDSYVRASYSGFSAVLGMQLGRF